MPYVDSRGHLVRFSDSSLYDERCVNCGATDARGDTGLAEWCPKAPLPPEDKFAEFHPDLAALLRKLADPKYTTYDIRDERLTWCLRGCKIR